MGRGLEHVDVGVSDEGDLTLTCLCDCATVTCVVLGGTAGRSDVAGGEWAYTCDGCGTSHWLTTYVATIGGQL